MFSDEMNRFFIFCREKVSLLGISICVFLSYGLLFKGAVGIDDEWVELYAKEGLVGQDRVAQHIINKFFNYSVFLPIWNQLIGLLLILTGILILLYVMEKNIRYTFPRYINTLIISLIISFPYIAKSAIFGVTSMGFVIFFCSIALYLSYLLLDKICAKYLCTAFFCFLIVFLFEKAYIIFFCQSVAFLILIKCYEEKDFKIIHLLKWGGCLLAGLMVAFFLSRICISIIQIHMGVSSSGYTSSYIKYDLTNITAFFSSLRKFFMEYIRDIFVKSNLYLGGKIYLYSIILMLGLSVYASWIKRDILNFIFAILNIILSGSVILATGNFEMPIRSYCYNYAFFIGFTIIYLFEVVKITKKITFIFSCVIVFLIGIQSREMEMIYHKKNCNFQKDKYTAELVLESIEEECGMLHTNKKPIIFMGFLNGQSIGYGEPEETTIFNWDRNSSVDLEQISHRIYKFYEKLGYSINMPSSKEPDYIEVRKMISTMSSFPEDGCVKETEDYIVVKLGDSLCEILTDYNLDDYQKEPLLGNLDTFSYENRMLTMNGWLVRPGENSFNYNMSLLLIGNDATYKMRIDECIRKDVTAYMSDGKDYDLSGYQYYSYLPEYISSGEYRICIETISGSEKYLHNLGKTIYVNEE